MVIGSLICKTEDCSNQCMSRGYGEYHNLCTKHHKQKYGMPYVSSDRKPKVKFQNSECVLCGWEGYCDRHRISMGKDGGKYTEGNVSSICPNCHRVLHMGEPVTN